MRKPAPVALFVLTLASALGALFAACADPDTQTPTCVNNVGANGLVATDGGCEGFASCVVNGNVAPASQCCVGDGGVPLTGNDLETCLFGFGDPSCRYLSSSYSDMGTNVIYTCSATAPDGAGGSSPGDGGADG
jgi:hypothetical protein